VNSLLFNKLVQMLPLIACGGFGVVVWTCVKVVEGVSKQPFKRQLAEVIATSSIFTVGKMLPAFALSAFDAIFTDELWSLRGFIRSCMASIVVVVIYPVFGIRAYPMSGMSTFTRMLTRIIPQRCGLS
jgi:hypothetical protein